MKWTEDAYERAAYRAPIGRELHRRDTRVIERPGWYQIVTPSAVGHLNEVYISKLAPEDADRAIDEVVAEYSSRPNGPAVKWCVGHWTEPKDFGERLRQRGFTRTGVRAMACSTDIRLEVPSGVTVDEVTRETLDAYVVFEARGWSMPDDQHAIQRETYGAALTASPRTAHFFAARVDGALVGSCAIFLREDFGYLVGGLVVPHARGRGIYRALVDARLAFLRARGISLAVTHARDATSAPMLEHLGFHTVYPYECWYLNP
ncbi:MAG: GNAT family N-acetyltransferase [Labilithrix sp.]|nr:GNAT family N-acetyltransferase [Labilithrix sp.]